VEPAPLDPSPNVQLNEYGVVPPLADAVNVTCWLVWGEEGLKVKLALSGGGGLVTVKDFEEVTVCCGDPLSVTVKTTVYEPAVAYAWVAVEPVPVEPSPKAQP